MISSISDEYRIVAEVSDGRQALEMIQIVKPDVVFTDLKMPYMGGIELIKAAQAAGMQAKYVIVSAYEEFEYARQAITLGVKDYLVKPITVDEVKNVMFRLEAEPHTEWQGSTQSQSLKQKYPDDRKRAILDRYAVSTESKKQFCFKEGISVGTLNRWLREKK